MTTTIVDSANLFLLPAAEAKLFKSMLGRRLDQVSIQAIFSVAFRFGSQLFNCYSEIGPGKSPSDPYEEVIRIALLPLSPQDFESYYRGDHTQSRAINTRISEIQLLTSLLLFTPPVEVGPTSVLGVEIPAGRGYSPYFLRPFTPEADAQVAVFGPQQLVNQVDMGVQFTLEDGSSFVIVTNGINPFVFSFWTDEDVQKAHRVSLPVSLDERITRE